MYADEGNIYSSAFSIKKTGTFAPARMREIEVFIEFLY
jgi:hypothetical protein